MKNYKFVCLLLITLFSSNAWSQTNHEGSRTSTIEFGFSGKDCLRGRDMCSDMTINSAKGDIKMATQKTGYNSFQVYLYSDKFSEKEQIKIAGKSFMLFE